MSSSARKTAAIVAAGATVLAGLVLAPSVSATPPSNSPSELAGDPGAVAALWTPAARAAAIPRDLVIDERGLGYLKRADGSLEPYGHGVAAASPQPFHVLPLRNASGPQPSKGKPGSTPDLAPPVVTDLSPDNTTVGETATLQASVIDDVAVRSAVVYVAYDSGAYTSYNASYLGADAWGITLRFNVDGPFSWYMTAKDTSQKTTTSDTASFTVDRAGGSNGGGGEGIVVNEAWTGGGQVQTAAGRIYFYMPANRKLTRWTGYVCSGTVVTDSQSGESVVLTAAHCVYDDVNKAFAKDAMFIPDQAASGTSTDRVCANDTYGCWVADYGVVDVDWTTRKFPANIPWDYAFYVLPDSSHEPGSGAVQTPSLETAVGSLGIDFSGGPGVGNVAQALGYSYSDDPNFMYCSESVTVEGSYGDWWLGQCGLSGGASGGPWQPAGAGDDDVFSVNSWGYTTAPGMAGPKLTGEAACVYGAVSSAPQNGGVIAACP